jgi:glycosyltransferase involved in cell wall biosynthesis
MGPRNGFRPEPRVAIVSDSMLQSGGAERVVEVLAEAFPHAPIFTTLYDPRRGPRAIEPRVVQSWLSRVPASRRLAKALIPFYPNAIESFDLREFDVILSSHHTLAKGVLRTSDQVHVCYCHTPMRSLWERPHEEVQRAPRVLQPLVKLLLQGLRSWDFEAASRVDQFVANSFNTATRISKHYRRESVVLYPPIDTDRFTPGTAPVKDFYLIAARNVPYKRIDLALAAADRLRRDLVVVGDSTDRLANPSPYIKFMGKVSDAKLMSLMREARALLFPQYEDFGMTVLEMNACGRPVIAYGKGGALETIIDGVTGVVFHEQSVESLAHAIKRFESLSFDSGVIRRHAERFSKHNFIARMVQIVRDAHVNETAASVEERRLSIVRS